MKKVIALAVAVVTLASMSAVVFAEEVSYTVDGGKVLGGMVDFDKPQARHMSEYVAGGDGIWNYDVNTDYVWSSLTCQSYESHTSVKAGSNKIKKSGWVDPKQTAHSGDSRAFSGNKAFYDYRKPKAE